MPTQDTSTLPPIPARQPAIPLTPELEAAYRDLYAQYEAAIEGSTDPGLLQELNESQLNVRNVLTKNAMYKLNATTLLFGALLTQIKDTNNDLKELKKQIAAVADHVATAGKIIGAIDKVLTLVAGV